ncbi:MAG: hypothetical protein ABSC94_22535 [Polyangiaceae bacterium]
MTDGFRTRAENGPESLENKPKDAPDGATVSSPHVTDRDRLLPDEHSHVTDEQLERAIVDAVTMGLVDVAQTLARQLEARRAARLPANVVPLDGKRGRG